MVVSIQTHKFCETACGHFLVSLWRTDVILIVLSCVAAFLVNWSQLLLTSISSALTHQLLGTSVALTAVDDFISSPVVLCTPAGQFKSLVLMAASAVFFESYLGGWQLAGCMLAMGSIVIHAYLQVYQVK
jgi:hypothetical protein